MFQILLDGTLFCLERAHNKFYRISDSQYKSEAIFSKFCKFWKHKGASLLDNLVLTCSRELVLAVTIEDPSQDSEQTEEMLTGKSFPYVEPARQTYLPYTQSASDALLMYCKQL
jgi:hypothetical protein